jgi:hypothetical protein
LDQSNITRHDYGGKIETDSEKFVEGLIELFDDLADFALSRIHRQTFKANPDTKGIKLPQNDINHFKLTWYVALGELMFFSLAEQPKFEQIRNAFYDEIETIAIEKDTAPFLLGVRAAIPKIISRDKNFVENGIFNNPMLNREENTPRNQGLGPELARLILETSFAINPLVGPIYENVLETFELEFNNAYGHCSIACATFTIT